MMSLLSGFYRPSEDDVVYYHQATSSIVKLRRDVETFKFKISDDTNRAYKV